VVVFGIALLAALPHSSAGLANKASTQTAGRVFVCNTLSGSVSAVDAESGAVLATIPVGRSPIRIVKSQDGRKVYTSNFLSSSVSVIDAVNLVVTATIPVTPLPQESDITIDGTRLFVVHHHSQVVSVIDLATDTVIKVVPIGVPPADGKTATDIAFTPDGRYALVPNYATNVVDFIDTTTYAVTAVPTGAQPRRVAITPNGESAFVANFIGNSVTAVDAQQLSVFGTVPAGEEARGIAVSPKGDQVAVTNVRDGTVTFFDPNTLAVMGTVRVGNKPWNLIYNAAGTEVIISNSGNDTVSVIDTATLTVTKTVDCENGPFFSVFNADETKLYVSCAGPLFPPFVPGFLTIIDTATWSVIGNTTLELQPFDMAFVDVAAPTPTPSPSPSATPTPTPPVKAQNLSTRVDVETGTNVGIGGFIISGTNPKLVVIRAIGPSLTDFDVPGALADPVLELHDENQAIIATNDDWMDNTPEDQQLLVDASVAPTNNLESAMIKVLNPGLYTAVVSGSNGGTGVALIELYDLDDPGAAGELVNISTRGFVGTGPKVMIGGLIVGPEGGLDASVVVRAIGPSLVDFGVTDPLLDPVLELRDVNGDLVAMNDDWATDPPPSNYSDEVTAAGLAPSKASESAIFANLTNGLYTAIVSGKDATTGTGLIEIYHVAAQ
jgi:YVTN family beta-propeller protein